ncbi:MAG: carbohydrate binding family 9 domain-containing protein [Flavobacterium sp.]|nr:carbohydrate binding family 9 domain-containing protein [Flavobacterium sp.]
MKKAFQILLIITSSLGYSQKKILKAVLIKDRITIDGNLEESQWQTAPIAKDFLMFAPDNGKEVEKGNESEVKILYDNEAIYIGATLYDAEPSKILKELTLRDDQGTSDNFGVFINGFNDGQQDFRFFCTASGTQLDCLATDTNGEDFSWDAIWLSKAKITDKGWVVEMKIPYAALRFSNNKVQIWGINFVRDLKRKNSIYVWNKVDNKLNNVIQQAGNLEGIENIKTPTRLFFLPYSSFYLNANDAQKTNGTLKGGMDIKYGINDAFTLDAILIPDFGQTKFDDQILNLGPFEQQFNENRAFFTEGTDLFNKGGLFYSRRIGGSPSAYPTVENNEEIIDNPATVNLINALKVSGRTKGGLGVGVLNAVTETTSAKIRNNTDQSIRSEVVEPLSNYSVLVLDQRFRKNSSLSFINTNVTRDGSFRDGNVSALVWDLNTKENTYNLSGDFKYSYVNHGGAKTGIASSLNVGETSGQFRYSLGGDLVTKDYDNNDLGINFQTNYYSIYGNANYRILKSTKYFNSFNIRFNAFSQFQKETGLVQGNNFNINVNINNKKNHYFGVGLNANPFENYDFYEPRAENRYVIIPSRIGAWFFFSSNYNYKFAFDFNPSAAKLDEEGRNTYGFSMGPRYRFSDRFLLNFNFNFSRQNNNKGFVDSIDNDANSTTPNAIIFANRNVITYSNTLSGKYSVNSTMTFNLSVRHYWSFAENKNFLSLDNQGRLNDYSNYTPNKNSNFTSWNVDLSYTWWFAPGSQISVLYRNNAANFTRNINSDFGSNVTNLLNNEALNHTFSLSMRYFIDYNQAKKLF